MSDDDQVNPITHPKNTDGERISLATRLMAMSGYILVACSAGLLIFLAFRYANFERPKPPEANTAILVWAIQQYGYELLIVIGSIVSGLFGTRMLGAAGKGAQPVIPPEDRELLEPLIANANENAIKQYVILSSLSGLTGTFQKIGFSGLPLATVTLTLIFSALSFVEAEFLELAKLTLGAFIGSFVQKGQDAPKIPVWPK